MVYFKALSHYLSGGARAQGGKKKPRRWTSWTQKTNAASFSKTSVLL